MYRSQSWFISDFAVGILPVESAEALSDKCRFPLDFLLSNSAGHSSLFYLWNLTSSQPQVVCGKENDYIYSIYILEYMFLFPFSSLSAFDSSRCTGWDGAQKPLLCSLHRWKWLDIVNRWMWKISRAPFDLPSLFFLSQGEETKTLSIFRINSFIPHLRMGA